MEAGDTFLVAEPGTSYDWHLWMVVSDPSIDSKRVLIVNLTSWCEDKDHSCVLGPGDHPYVRHRSCVNYGGAKVVSAAEIERLLEAGRLASHTPISSELLTRIRQAVPASRMALGHVALLEKQGLVEL